MIRLGMIGTGRIAQRFVEAVEKVKELQLVCVYNPHCGSAERFVVSAQNVMQGEISLATDSWEKLMEITDAVYIASPHETHYKYIKMALLENKHVLCEKPMALCAKEAQEVYDLAEKQKCVLLEAVKTAYCPGFLAMMELAQSGVIGEICDVEACFTKLVSTNMREYTDTVYGGSFTELGSYSLLPIMKLIGTDYQDVKFQSVYAPNGVDKFTKASFIYANGMGLAKTGIGVKSEGELIISGTKGYIYCEAPWWLTKHFEVRYENAAKRDAYEYEYEGSGLQYELAYFVRKIYGQEVNLHAGITRNESVETAHIMEKFLKENGSRRSQNYSEQERNIRIWAHRGCSMAYPENTLPAFEAAAKLPNVTGIELDVQLSKDGEIVVFHDESVSRVTDGDGRIADLTLQELRELRFKHDHSQTFIPTLREVLERLKPYCIQRGLLINIELKTGVIHYRDIEKMTVSLVKELGMQDYIVYSSFWPESLRLIKQYDPNSETGMLAGYLSDCINGAREVNADALHPWIGGMDCNVPEEMRQFPVRAYNGEEPFYQDGRVLRIKSLTEYAMFGVTDIFTNVPESVDYVVSLRYNDI